MTRYPQAMLKGGEHAWTEDFELDERLFTDQTKRLIDSGYRHLYVLGDGRRGACGQ